MLKLRLLLCLCLFGCVSQSQQKNEASPVEISTYSEYDLTADELNRISKASLNGDASASYRLFEYYQLSRGNNIRRGNMYLRRAAEQGNQTAVKYLDKVNEMDID